MWLRALFPGPGRLLMSCCGFDATRAATGTILGGLALGPSRPPVLGNRDDKTASRPPRARAVGRRG